LFGSLKSKSGWIGSLNYQPVVGRAESDRVISYCISTWNVWKFKRYGF